MPQYMKGDMWTVLGKVQWFCITTNAIVKNNGALVMGAGIARQMRDRYPGIDLACGEAVRDSTNSEGVYGFIRPRLGLGLFQVKRHFKGSADLELIQRSTKQLHDYAAKCPGLTFALNFPGIGNGKLDYAQVKPIVDQLPDNVQIWTFN